MDHIVTLVTTIRACPGRKSVEKISEYCATVETLHSVFHSVYKHTHTHTHTQTDWKWPICENVWPVTVDQCKFVEQWCMQQSPIRGVARHPLLHLLLHPLHPREVFSACVDGNAGMRMLKKWGETRMEGGQVRKTRAKNCERNSSNCDLMLSAGSPSPLPPLSPKPPSVQVGIFSFLLFSLISHGLQML